MHIAYFSGTSKNLLVFMEALAENYYSLFVAYISYNLLLDR
jgi:hypothetical protein